jgi:hypothetical protein
MSPIPVYLKTDATTPRPEDSEFFWVTRDGIFFCRNHPFFRTDLPSKRPVKALASHEPSCFFQYPKVTQGQLEFIVGFFDRVYETYQSEAVVLLYWDLLKKRYKLWIPDQEATVREFWDGDRVPEDVRYTMPMQMPPHYLLVGDIHSHGNLSAYSSYTDKLDEKYRDGVHGVVGKIDRDPPEFHLEFCVDGARFGLEFDDLFTGYGQRRKMIPRKWLDKVKVEMERVKRSPMMPWWLRDSVSKAND